jgi:hypothetical protein
VTEAAVDKLYATEDRVELTDARLPAGFGRGCKPVLAATGPSVDGSVG